MATMVVCVCVFVDDYQTCQLLSLILELITFCVEHHSYHIKNYIVGKDLIRRVLVLLKSKHAFLALCKYLWHAEMLLFLRFVKKVTCNTPSFFLLHHYSMLLWMN